VCSGGVVIVVVVAWTVIECVGAGVQCGWVEVDWPWFAVLLGVVGACWLGDLGGVGRRHIVQMPIV